MQSASASPSLLRGTRIAFWITSLTLAAAANFIHRYEMNPDGISYLDLSDRFWNSGWSSVVNAYWSPLYPILISPFTAHASTRAEFPLVHALNFVIFLFTLFCFDRFCRMLPARGLLALTAVYFTFAFCHLTTNSLFVVTPDLLVAGLTYASFAVLMHLMSQPPRIVHALLLGSLLALAYYAKTFMFPFGIAMLAISTLFAKLPRRRWYLVAAFVVFLALSAPLVISVSRQVGKLSFGETGALNYAWFVNRVHPQYSHWQRTGPFVAAHPTRRISDSPLLYEFDGPIIGTYPVWLDPAYWNLGVDTHFNPVRQVEVLARGLFDYIHAFLIDLGLLSAAMLFAVANMDRTRARTLFNAPSLRSIATASLVYLMMYALVHWEFRLVMAPLVALYAIAFCLALADVRPDARTQRSCAYAAFAVTLLASAYAITGGGFALRDVPGRDQLQIAEDLQAQGFHPGDRVAVIGSGFDAFWARLAHLRIVAEFPQDAAHGSSPQDFWASPEDRRAAALQRLKALGVSAVIDQNHPSIAEPHWTRLQGTSAAVLVLRPSN